MAQEKEYEDLINMMDNVKLSAMENTGDYFTWSNKRAEGIIYFRIDHLLVNAEWFQAYIHANLNTLVLGISDHALLHLDCHDQTKTRRKYAFKFLISATEIDEYHTVYRNWNLPIAGNPMQILWKKLMRMQPIIRALSKPIVGVTNTLQKARSDLIQARERLVQDRLNTVLINEVKTRTEEVCKWSEIEEQTLKQRPKINWLRLEDGNNKFFYAQLKVTHVNTAITSLYKFDGTIINIQQDIANEVLILYGNLMGRANENLKGIDIVAMREGPQLNCDQRKMLISPITEQ